MRKWFWLLALLMGPLSLTGYGAVDPGLDVDWPAFMARQDLHWQALPKLWDEAPFLSGITRVWS